MSIERRPWLALLCLPLLTSAVARLRADGLEGPADDFLTVWRTFSDAARQNAAPETANTDPPSFRWFFGSSPSIAPVTPFVRPAGAILDPSPIASRNDTDAAPPSLWEEPDGRPRKINQKSDGLLGSLSTQVEVTDASVASIWDDPSWKRTWRRNDSWQLGIAGPIAVFGQFGANSDEAGQSDMKVSGRTGLACKVPVGSLAEFTFRSGPGVSYTDPLHPLRTQGRSDWLLEVQARWPLLFGIGLEYQGSANPALTPLQQDIINQDLRLALPLGRAGKLKVGAKHQWMGLLEQRTAWSDSTQLYLGLELSR